MDCFAVYQQLTPTHTGKGNEHRPNVVLVGVLWARDAREAINSAREWPRFQVASRLGRHPLVENLTAPHTPQPDDVADEQWDD